MAQQQFESFRREHKPDFATDSGLAFDSLMAVLANTTRMEVLFALARSSQSVTSLAEELELDAFTISHALRALRELGIASHQPRKKYRIYFLTDKVDIAVHGSVIRLRIGHASGAVTIEHDQSRS